MTTQLPFGFDLPPAFGCADFVPTEGNREALAWLTGWPNWPSHGLVLYGACGSGKTHLSHIWAVRAGAEFLESPVLDRGARVVLEGVDRFMGDTVAEEGLFHLLNSLAARKGHILLTASSAPVLWSTQLPDLRSRLLALPAAHIGSPDDDALMAVISKLFADRQLRVSADVVDYMVRRIERSYTAAQVAVVALDAAALASGRAVTLPLVREILAQQVGEP